MYSPFEEIVFVFVYLIAALNNLDI